METKDFYALLRDRRNRENPFARENGIIITELTKGHAVVELKVEERHKNPLGTVHGGCIFTICDMVAGSASSSYGHWVTTVDADIHFIRPTRGVTYLRGENREIKAGRNLIVNEISVTDQDGREVAMGIFTFMQLDQVFEEFRLMENK